MTRRVAAILTSVAAAAVLTGCGGSSQSESAVCANGDGGLDNKAFVFVEGPRSGERVLSGFRVTGCSSTFEANVNWRLRARDGHVLSKGFAQGGSQEPGSFAFTVDYPIGARQIGQLEVFEPRVTEEGFPAAKNLVPLVLEP
jgi:immunoglobulin-like protein involved in spore germination